MVNVPLTQEIEAAIYRLPPDVRPKRAIFAYHGIPYDATIRALSAESKRIEADIARLKGPWTLEGARNDGLSVWLNRRRP